VWDGVAEEDDVEVGVQDAEADRQRVEDHLGADVHLADEVRTAVGAGDGGGAVVGVVVARQRGVAEQLARTPTDADEQEIVDAERPQRRLVQVDGHVDERRVHERQHHEPALASTHAQTNAQVENMRRLVQVDGHVDERRVHQRQHYEPVSHSDTPDIIIL